MRLKVRHLTRYKYSDPVQSAVQMIRATPRPCANQFVRNWRIEVDADARLEKSEDAYGNIVHVLDIEGPLTEANILIEGEVDTHDLGGLVQGTLERQPTGLFLRSTALTEPSSAMIEFARDIAAGEGGDMHAALHRINATLHDTMDFKVGTTTAETSAAESFAARTGVCQDFTHVFCAAARTLGVPARYVSGYYMLTDRTDQDAGHAWAEAFLPGMGWIGFDPANRNCPTDRYIRVAIGADSREAATVRGARNGGGDETLTVTIDVTQGRSLSQTQSQSQNDGNGGSQGQSQS
ncbi:MAG: transglutaminase family protein [Hyphomicrobiaceae bacterium]|nr:transglutaminase family protein [Hyphomicrobiaceae bacterium]